MTKKMFYPTKHTIVHINEIINIMSNRKADQHRLLKAPDFIDIVLENSKDCKGDVYDKAAVLLHGLVTTHGFASGNKRTGFITAIWFLRRNGCRIRVKNFNRAERIIKSIRTFDTVEIADWLRRGNIDETKIE